MKQTIVLAGATGFIGRWIIEEFQDEYQIIALSRKKVKTNPNEKIIFKSPLNLSQRYTSTVFAYMYLYFSNQIRSALFIWVLICLGPDPVYSLYGK